MPSSKPLSRQLARHNMDSSAISLVPRGVLRLLRTSCQERSPSTSPEPRFRRSSTPCCGTTRPKVRHLQIGGCARLSSRLIEEGLGRPPSRCALLPLFQNLAIDLLSAKKCSLLSFLELHFAVMSVMLRALPTMSSEEHTWFKVSLPWRSIQDPIQVSHFQRAVNIRPLRNPHSLHIARYYLYLLYLESSGCPRSDST